MLGGEGLVGINVAASGDGDEVLVRRRDVTLAKLVVPPGHDRPVELQTQAVKSTPGGGLVVGVGRRYEALAVVASSPGDDGPVGPEAEAVPLAPIDCHETVEFRLLYNHLTAPSHDGPDFLSVRGTGADEEQAEAHESRG